MLNMSDFEKQGDPLTMAAARDMAAGESGNSAGVVYARCRTRVVSHRKPGFLL